MDGAPYKSAKVGGGRSFECFAFDHKSVPMTCLQRLDALGANNWTNNNVSVLANVVHTTWFVWCTAWLVPGNPFAPLGLNSNYDIHSATRLISN